MSEDTVIEILTNEVEKYKDALFEMVWQHAYRGSDGERIYLYSGFLSANEWAFEALGWEDPHYIEEGNSCDVSDCFEWPSMGGVIKSSVFPHFHLKTCNKHDENIPVSIKERVIDKEQTRCKECGYNMPQNPPHLRHSHECSQNVEENDGNNTDLPK